MCRYYYILMITLCADISAVLMITLCGYYCILMITLCVDITAYLC